MGTVAGQALDRRAVAPVLSLYGARLTDCPLELYYNDTAAYVRGQAAIRSTFDPDALFAPFALASIGAAFGSELQYFADQAPNIKRPAIRSAQDWDHITMPDPDTHPRLLYFREAIRQMAAEHRGEVPIVGVMPAPTDLPALIMGLEAWLETMLFDPSRAREIMAVTTPFFVELANDFFADGATVIASPCAFVSPVFVTRETVVSLSRPALETALSQLNGPLMLHHGGATISAHLDLLTGLPSVIALALDQKDDLATARAILGPDLVLFGGPAGPTLNRLTAEEVQSVCLSMLVDRSDDTRFILYSCGPDIPWDTPVENIAALCRSTLLPEGRPRCGAPVHV
ncbi:MAG: uroporphyrinogen decarboxylase [candidate division Zixibacteria bacterium]|nr:uroporphyrinogen decarboxylase [candidate division Zixibacteria bacterium]